MPEPNARRALLGFGAGLLLAGLAACSGSPEPRRTEPQAEETELPEKALSVTVPGGEEGLQAASSGGLPEPQAESPVTAAAPAAEPSRQEVPALQGEPALSGEPAPAGPAAAGQSALPEPRPPAERAKAEAKAKSPAASQPAKASKTPPAPANRTATPEVADKARVAVPPEPREVLARKGDTVVIDLEGRGWLLLPGDRQGVSFLGSESGPQRTSFSFKALELGDYELAFQLQDNARGASTGEVVRLRVLPDEKLRDLLARQAAPPAAAPGAPLKAGFAAESADPARLEKAERLFAGGFFDLALPEYLALYREADPLLNDRLAAIYLQKGEAAAAAKFYDRNLSAPSPYGRQAVVGLVRAGLAMASPELVLQHLPALLELPASETGAELLAVARFAASQGSYPLALELLTEYLRRNPRGMGLDAAYFQLAQLYELDSPLRDVRLAREYYRRVYEDFPESEHAAQAHRRILYLDRHFFHVQ